MKRCFFYFLCIGLIAQVSCSAPNGDKLPNILFVLMDDLGYGQWGIYNGSLSITDFDPYFVSLVEESQAYDPQQALDFSRMATPNMSRLAGEGVLFTSAFTSSSLCAPSRLGIATGTMQNRIGIYRNTDCEERGLEPGSHLAEKLHEMGYATAHIGKWHIGRRNDQLIKEALRRSGIKETDSLGGRLRRNREFQRELNKLGYYGSVIDAHNPLQNGFDYYFGYNHWASQFYNSNLVWENYTHAGRQKGYNTDVFTDTALSFIQKQVAAEKPFYVQLHFHAVHDSLQPKAPDAYYNRFNASSYDLNNFYAHVYGVDYNLGRIMEYLQSIGQDENTIIVFSADNGAQAGGPSVLPGNAPFSGHKGTYFQGGIRVPLFFYWPAGIPDHRQLDHLVSSMDILPTLIDAAGGALSAGIDGRSLLPMITGKSTAPVHDHLLWAGLHARAWGFLLNKSFKDHGSERNHAPGAWVVIKDDYMLRFVGSIEPNLYYELPDGGPPVFQLYNFREDPAETINLTEDMPDKVKELTAIYHREAAGLPPPVVWSREKWNEIDANRFGP